MALEIKITIVFAIIFTVIGLLWKFPNTQISRFLFTWYGPIPKEGESYERFTFRYSFYAFKWLVTIVLIWIAISWITNGDFDSQPTIVMAVIAFVLPLFAGIALLGGVGLLVKATYLHYSNPTKIFSKEIGDFKEYDE